MRWAALADFAERHGLLLPTYRQMDVWTRAGLLTAEMRGDRHGQYRWWPADDIKAALTVARLAECGIDKRLGFEVARTPSDFGRHTYVVNGITVIVDDDPAFRFIEAQA
jgi:hypothetical protein